MPPTSRFGDGSRCFMCGFPPDFRYSMNFDSLEVTPVSERGREMIENLGVRPKLEPLTVGSCAKCFNQLLSVLFGEAIVTKLPETKGPAS